MVLQPSDDPLRVTPHWRGRSVFDVFEDGVKHWTGTLPRAVQYAVDLAVNVRKEEQLLSPLTMKREKCTDRSHPAFREIGHQRGSS